MNWKVKCLLKLGRACSLVLPYTHFIKSGVFVAPTDNFSGDLAISSCFYNKIAIESERMKNGSGTHFDT